MFSPHLVAVAKIDENTAQTLKQRFAGKQQTLAAGTLGGGGGTGKQQPLAAGTLGGGAGAGKTTTPGRRHPGWWWWCWEAKEGKTEQ